MINTKYIFSILLAVGLLAACSPNSGTGADDSPATTIVPGDSASVDNPLVPTTTIDLQAIFGLTYMREEEKLARDVYQALYGKWEARVFQNIAESEQQHTDAVAALLPIYGLPDPAAGTLAGQFSDPTLQALYDELTVLGSTSLADAFKVGAAIEEIDILDLQHYLESDIPADVRLVYENLLTGSYNHLVAFTSTLERQTGEIYIPQYMTPEAYAEALALGSSTGHGD